MLAELARGLLGGEAAGRIDGEAGGELGDGDGVPI